MLLGTFLLVFYYIFSKAKNVTCEETSIMNTSVNKSYSKGVQTKFKTQKAGVGQYLYLSVTIMLQTVRVYSLWRTFLNSYW